MTGKAAAWLALLGLLATACQPTPAPPAPRTPTVESVGGSFTEAVAGVAGYLNPLFADEDNARDIDGLIYQGLTAIGPDQQVQPLLAKEIQVSTDQRTYSAMLRPDVRWADGQPFSADDVVFTFGVLQDPQYTLPEAATWQGVVVKKVADDQVDFTLKAPSAGFLNSLRIGILPQHLFAGPVAAIPSSPYSGSRAIGTGPFQVAAISPDRSTVTLRRNPHASPTPLLDEVVFKSYASLHDAVTAVAAGAADAVGGELTTADARLLDAPGIEVHDVPSFSFAAVFLDLDSTHPYFSDPAVRRALSEAIDRPALVREVLHGSGDPQSTSLPPAEWAYSAEAARRFPYDPEAAQRELDAAGWTVPPQSLYRSRQGVDFRIDLIAADAYPFKEVAAVLRDQLAKVGVGVKVDVVPADELVTRHIAPRTFQMALANLDNGPDPDQFSFWHSSEKGYPLNFSDLPRQAFIDKDLEDGRAAAAQADRLAAYADLEDLLVDAAPALFLYSPHYEYAVSKRVGGVHLNPVVDPGDRFQYITDWFV